MRTKRLLPVLLAMAIVFTLACYAVAAEPQPFPSEHIEALLGKAPELKDLYSPSWLMTGYRYFYDLYYYDNEDQVVDSAMLVFDVVGKGFEHVVTNCYLAKFAEDGALAEFTQQYYVIDHPGIGEFWINIEALKDESMPAVASGALKLGEFEPIYELNGTGEAWYAAVTSADGSTDTELYFDPMDGLLLMLDDYTYDDEDNYIGGTSLMFYKMEEYYSPWLDFGFKGLETGIEISYDIEIVYGDGSSANGIMTFYPEENYGSWAYLWQYLESEELGNSTDERIISEMCLDGLMIWMPIKAFEYIVRDDVYYEEDLIGSIVMAGDMVDLGELGLAREIQFKDGFFMADSYFRPEDGFMVKYYQYPTDQKPFEITLTLREIK